MAICVDVCVGVLLVAIGVAAAWRLFVTAALPDDPWWDTQYLDTDD